MKQGDAKFWARSCLQKKAMKLEHAIAVVERAKAEGSFLRHYLCEICCRYHVTKQPLTIPKKKAKSLVWVDADERLPNPNVHVKVQTRDGKFTRGFFISGFWIGKDNGEVLDVVSWLEVA